MKVTQVKMRSSYQLDSFRIMAVKNTVRFGSYKLENNVFENVNALRVSWIKVIPFMYSRRKERICEKLMFYPK